jgi:hypothetical protein
MLSYRDLGIRASLAAPLIFAGVISTGQPTYGAALTAQDVLAHPVPDPLTFLNGKPVKRPGDWQRRRTELLNLFSEHVYGKTPRQRGNVRIRYEALSDRAALNGIATRKQIGIYVSNGSEERVIHVLLYVPAKAKEPVPVFVGLNFQGNPTVSTDDGIALTDVWTPSASTSAQGLNKERQKQIRQKASPDTRGKTASRWPIETIVWRGYGVATAYCGDIDPDFAPGFQDGVRPLYLRPGATQPGPEDWGTLGAWAWGLSRIADALESDPAVDVRRLAIIGHSRLGKAALWAAAQDQRFTIVISNESGVGGASLYRAKSGETIEHLNTFFPQWFCLNFHQYTNHPERVPVDGNLLLSLIAPRPLYVGSAAEDHTSNPTAEFYSAVLASRVYEFLGKKGLGTTQMPAENQPIMHTVGYHVRSGKHDITFYDWNQYLKFADLQWQGGTKN